METCVFCNIVKGTIPAAKVYEDDKVLAFLDINPVNPGHVLLIPKGHHPMMTDTPDAVVADLFVEAKKLMIAIQKAMGADFVSVSVVGTDVPHLHVHLTPRYFKDGLAGWPTKKYGSEAERKRVAEKISSAL